MKRTLIKYSLMAVIASLLTACGKPSDPAKARYQAGANFFYGNIVKTIQTAKGITSSSRRGATSFNGSGSLYNGNFNSQTGYYTPANNVYMYADPQQEIQKCRTEYTALKQQAAAGGYYKYWVVSFFQCLQAAAVGAGNPYNSYMYRQSGQAQNPWQYTNFNGYPGAYSQYYSQQYPWMNQYLSNGYLQSNATPGQYGY